MTGYVIKRILHGIISIIIVTAAVMVMIYSLLDRNLIFADDPAYSRQKNNTKITYKYQQWEKYGYLDYVTYQEWIKSLTDTGGMSEDQYDAAMALGQTPKKDSEIVKKYVNRFTEYWQEQGFTVERLNAKMANPVKVADGGQQQLFAYKDIPLYMRLLNFFGNLITFDNINRVSDDVGERGLTFTLFDPVYGGDKFAPAIMGNGTIHRYLLYFDGNFPFIHQNFVTINLGMSFTVNRGVDVFQTMTDTQGPYVMKEITFPTGYTEMSADDLHTAVYSPGSLNSSAANQTRFDSNYTNVELVRGGFSKIGYSFVIGITATAISYLIGIPLGIMMARRKDKLTDKLGTIYIVFIIAVPSLAYIFLFRSIGGAMGLPTVFDMESPGLLMYVLPIVSLALPAAANLMKWMRRYTIDGMNSDYVKFARSGGLSEKEIFSRHILKNSIIPIVHGIPAGIFTSLIGAIITERVYVVPGAGNLLTEAVNKYDNGVIAGITMFYALLSVASVILGDILMAMADPRITFSSKDR